jgi:hypothetical protein
VQILAKFFVNSQSINKPIPIKSGAMSMVIYEVNLKIQNNIFQAYYEWLLSHIKQLLNLPGFVRAEMGLIENEEEDNQNHLRISYYIDSYENLNQYLTHFAQNMREAAIQQFGNQFSASRRIILEPIVID